jgi:hypothetical protein
LGEELKYSEVYNMAKYRWRTKYKKRGRRKSSGGGSGMKPIIDGLIAGVAGQFASKYIGVWGHPAATVAVGMWRKNQVLKTEGARELGIALASTMPFIGGGGPQGTTGAFE